SLLNEKDKEIERIREEKNKEFESLLNEKDNEIERIREEKNKELESLLNEKDNKTNMSIEKNKDCEFNMISMKNEKMGINKRNNDYCREILRLESIISSIELENKNLLEKLRDCNNSSSLKEISEKGIHGNINETASISMGVKQKYIQSLQNEINDLRDQNIELTERLSELEIKLMQSS
ncbi:myosin tail 1 protein, partial [Cryptosporidium ryanae]|uniref:myosin tail 1 protein n=1 Tax=Cryptosporidium ryanae TaxID=515981 RepID=UPI00351A34FA